MTGFSSTISFMNEIEERNPMRIRKHPRPVATEREWLAASSLPPDSTSSTTRTCNMLRSVNWSTGKEEA